MNDPHRLNTGIGALDDILQGGLIAERLYLIDGNPGSGKTTFALQFLLEGVRHNEKCLYVTLSETRQELEDGARSHGWSLDGIDVVELIPDEQHELDGDGAVTMIQPSDVELSQTMAKILNAIERSDPARVAFDSLSEMRLLAQSSLRYRRQILALKQFFAGRKCTVLMLDDRDLQVARARDHAHVRRSRSLQTCFSDAAAFEHRLRFSHPRVGKSPRSHTTSTSQSPRELEDCGRYVWYRTDPMPGIG